MVSTASSILPLHDKIQERKGQRDCSGFSFYQREQYFSSALHWILSYILLAKAGLTPTPKQITGQEYEMTGVGQDPL